MTKERENVITKINQTIQVLLTVGAFFLTCSLGNLLSTGSYSDNCLFLAFLIAPLWFILTDQNSLGLIFAESWTLLFFKCIKVIIVGSAMMWLASVFLNFSTFDFGFWSFFGLLNLTVLFMYEVFIFSVLKFIRRKNRNKRQILLIADENSKSFICKMMHTPDWGYHLWGLVYPSEDIDKSQGDIKIFSPNDDIKAILDQGIVDEVFYCKSSHDQKEVDSLIDLCSEIGIVLRLRPVMNPVRGLRAKLSLFHEEPFFVFRNVPENYMALKIKRLFDIAFSLVVLIVLSPVYIIIALLIKLDDGGPIFFSQERVGLNGRRFFCLKFRTMVVNAEALRHQLMSQNEQSGPVFKIKMDPRITRVGRFLRKTSLDELPQFINVLAGDMSVVGPRPPIPSEVEQYERWQNRRLSMKPGITCIWQVSGRNNIPFEEWVRMDIRYIDNWSLQLDIRIILKTVKVILTGDGQ